MRLPPLTPEDLGHVLDHTRDIWQDLRGQRLFLTGGTGFFGSWLLETFAHANGQLALGASVTVLSRNPARFAAKAPHLSRRSDITFLTGDTRDFPFPSGEFPFILHAAAEPLARNDDAGAPDAFTSIVSGTQRVLEFSAKCGAKHFLLTSSGAVYGKQPDALSHIPEDYPGAPDPLVAASSYGEAKRASEFLCAAHGRRHGYEVKIARCFAFVGPHLPLDGPYAAGNFLRDALDGNPIHIAGDGTPRRSYLYAADLAIWLWTILFRGKPGRAYNVGSPNELSIAELAALVAEAFPVPPPVHISRPAVSADPVSRYVPDTTLAARDLNLRPWTPLPDAIRKTAAWHLLAPA